MKIIPVVLFSVFYITAPAHAQKTDQPAGVDKKFIYGVTKNQRNTKISIGFIDSVDSTKSTITAKVLKDGKYSYIKLGTDSYYLNTDTAAAISNYICDELNKITPDTTLRYGEPLAKAIVIAFIINAKGEVVTYGIARGLNDSYYENAAWKILKQYSNYKGEPARIKGVPVSCLLRIAVVFHQDRCLIVPFQKN